MCYSSGQTSRPGPVNFAMAERENIADILWHLGRSFDESEPWNDWSMTARRGCALRALQMAGR
jgi:hypothetical protein